MDLHTTQKPKSMIDLNTQEELLVESKMVVIQMAKQFYSALAIYSQMNGFTEPEDIKVAEWMDMTTEFLTEILEEKVKH